MALGNILTRIKNNQVTTRTLTGNTLANSLVYDSSMSVTGAVTVGNVVLLDSSGNISASGNVTAGNIVINGATSTTGNVTAGNVSATANVVGGNVLSGGFISAVGNIIGGNVKTAGVIETTSNVIAGNVNTNSIVGTGLTLTSTGNISLSPTANVILNNTYINGLNDPVQAQDAASKAYVDSVASGLDPKASVVYATTTALSAYTYNNGTSGVGATITSNTNGAFSIDGATPTANARVLIKNETGADDPYNGIYVVTTVGNAGAPYVLTRSTDFDTGSEVPSAFTFVEAGTANADTGWVCTTNAPVTIGTTPILFTQFSGAGQYNAGTGLTLAGTTFSISNTAVSAGSFGSSSNIATFTVNQQGQLTAANAVSIAAPASLLTGNTLTSNIVNSSLTSVGTLGNLSVAGNVTTGNIIVPGTALVGATSVNLLAQEAPVMAVKSSTGAIATALDLINPGAGTGAGAAIDFYNYVGNATYGPGAQITSKDDGTFSSELVFSTKATTGQPNAALTTRMTLTSDGQLSVVGNIISSANVAGANIIASANVIGGNITTGGLVSATGNIAGGNVLTGGAVSATGNITGGNIATTGAFGAASLSASGNVTGGNVLTGGLISATSTITSAANIAGGNILTGGLVSATGNATSGNVLTGGLVSATGNIDGGNLNAVGLNLSGNVLSSLNVPSGNITTAGIVSATANVTGGNILTGGLISATGNATLGNVTTGGLVSATGAVTAGNVYTGGEVSAVGNVTANTGSFFIGNGSQLTGVAASSVNANALTGNTLASGVIFSSLTTVGNLTSLVVTGNTTGGNLLTAGLVSAGGNIEGGNITTAGLVSATGNLVSTANVNSANVNATGAVSVTGNVIGGNITTAGLVSATGNVTGGNLVTAGLVSATGNITGGNVNAAGLSLSGNVVGNLNVTGNVAGGNLLTAGLVSATGGVTSTANVTGGNILTGGVVSATSNVIGGNVVTNTVVGTGLTLNSTGNINLSPVTGNVVLNSTYINGLLDPVQAQDAATKEYVDSVAQGLDAKASVHTATTAGLPAYTYNNGTSGVGATLTANANGALVISGETIVSGQRVLVKNETAGNAPYNGIYLCTTEGTAGAAYVLTRAVDFDKPAEMYSAFTFVETGTGVADTGWVCTNNVANPITIGTTDIVFTQFSGAGQYTAGTGLGLNGTQFYLANTAVTPGAYGNATAVPTFTVNQQGQLTVANTTAFNADAALLVGNTLSANVIASSLTSVGILANLSVTGNTTGGNLLTGGLISATSTITSAANITGGNVLTGGLISATSTITSTANITGGNLLTGGLISSTGTITSTANIAGGNILTGGLISSTGTITSTANITGGNLLTSGAGGDISGTGNITGGNVLTGGAVSATGAITGANVSTGGYVSATGNITGGNVLFGSGIVSGTGNISAGYYFGNGSQLTGVAASSVNANALIGNTLSSNVTFSSLTQVGTLANLSVTGDTTGGNLLTGGLISATSTITSAANITGGNVLTGGLVSATANVTGGNILTGGLISATGNVTGGNLNAAGLSLSGNVIGNLNVTGNIAGGNISTVGTANLGNIGISGDTITGTNGIVKVNSALGNIDFAVSGQTANVFYVSGSSNTASFGSNAQTANALVAFNATNSILIPVGNTAQRPGTGAAGMVRYNTTTTQVEAYNGTTWVALGSSFTLISSETFNGDGTTTSFTLNSANYTTDSVIVTLNGVVQQPSVAYAVSGTSLVFTEAPAVGDVIVVRELQTTSTVASISSGDSTLGFATANGNAAFTIAGTSNVMVVSQNGVDITGNLTVSGNATLSGNILGDRIQNGTTTIDIQSPSGNANITVAATSNVAVFTTGGLNLLGNLSATANVIGGNLNASGLSLSGNVVSAINTTANVTAGFFIGNGSQLTGVVATGIGTLASLSVTGNTTSGNLLTAGQVSATGNITGSYIIGNGSQLTGLPAGYTNANLASLGSSVISTSGNITGGNINTGNITITGDLISSLGATITIDPATAGNTGHVVINGNLQVNGTTTTINSNVVSTNDLTVNYANNAINSSAANGGGIEVGPIGSPYITWLYNSTANVFTSSGGVSAVGNITGGNLSVGTGTVTVGNIVNSNGNGVGNIGSSSLYFNTVFAKATSAQYADLAELYTADAEYEPGTVVEFGGTAEVTLSSKAGSTRVAGVVSTNPSYIMNSTLQSEHVAVVALQGRVPCKVIGPVSKGDMMVAAGGGYAKVDNNAKAGTIIGKALEVLHDPHGIIEVVVGRN